MLIVVVLFLLRMFIPILDSAIRLTGGSADTTNGKAASDARTDKNRIRDIMRDQFAVRQPVRILARRVLSRLAR